MNGFYKTGLVSVSFRGHTPLEILKEMKKAGLSMIEWGSDVHAPCNDTEKLLEIAALQKEFGVVCSSYGTYFRLGETPLEELSDYISAAKILGTNVLRLWCGTKSGADMTASERNSLLDVCRDAEAIARQHGVILCMECHKKTFTENTCDAVWLMEQIASEHFKMYWQPFQWQSVEQNVENAARIAPYTQNIHVFNWKDKDKFPLGDAVDEWRDYLKKFSNDKTLLLEFMPDGNLETLSKEADSLKKIIGG